MNSVLDTLKEKIGKIQTKITELKEAYENSVEYLDCELIKSDIGVLEQHLYEHQWVLAGLLNGLEVQHIKQKESIGKWKQQNLG